MDNENNEEIMDIEFKAINEGLGFHQNMEKIRKERLNISRPARKIENNLDNMLQPRSYNTIQNSSSDKADLNVFYKTPVIGPMDKVTEKPLIKQSVVEAKLEVRMLAWLLDFVVIFGMILVITALLLLFSGLSVNYLKSILSKNDIIFYSIFIFSSMYLFYFTIMDATSKSSLGKSLFDIRLTSKEDNVEYGLISTLLRAFVTLISIFLIGLPVLLDFQDLLSGTKVVSIKGS